MSIKCSLPSGIVLVIEVLHFFVAFCKVQNYDQ